MSNILSKLPNLSDQECEENSDLPSPFICYGLEHMNFISHIIGTVKIHTVEEDLYDN